MKNGRVAVVGLGASGLVALKNLREAGFDAVGFDSNAYVGGLWMYTPDPTKTSVLKSTVANLSKHLGCYTDFPYPDNAPDFPLAHQAEEYLEAYADHFDLRRHARLQTRIERVGRRDGQWVLKATDVGGKTTSELTFDRVIIAAGLQVQSPKLPDIKGTETFTGHAIHSNAYKNPEDYKGKNVVVVGLGNTGPDIAVDLIGHAKNVWLSHRRGNAIFSRRNASGKPGDFVLSLRGVKLGGIFNKHFPSLSQWAVVLGMNHMTKKKFNIPAEWGLREAHPPTRKVPTLSDTLVSAVHQSQVHLKRGLTAVNGSTLTFADGSQLSDIDNIVFATGFRSDFSYLDPAADPTRDTRKDWSGLPGANSRPLPRLYQGIFSLDFPDSLAFIGTSPLTPQANMNYDISSAAVAQIWAGKSTLPSRVEMEQHVDAQHESVCRIAATGELANTNLRNNWDWYKWCDEAAGLGVVKRTSWSVEGWKFWLADRQLSNLVNGGIFTPHIFRLFDEGKRTPWEDARKAVEKTNADAKMERTP